MKKVLTFLCMLVVAAAASASPVLASSVCATGSTGVDVSFPNCSASIPKVAFGIVGATGGPVYSTNNCLAAEASYFSNLSLYMNTGLYTGSDSTYYAQGAGWL